MLQLQLFLILRTLKLPMTYILEGIGALVNEAGEEQPLQAGDFALVNSGEKLAAFFDFSTTLYNISV
jgi:uncharacterized cupin superfamily protein